MGCAGNRRHAIKAETCNANAMDLELCAHQLSECGAAEESIRTSEKTAFIATLRPNDAEQLLAAACCTHELLQDLIRLLLICSMLLKLRAEFNAGRVQHKHIEVGKLQKLCSAIAARRTLIKFSYHVPKGMIIIFEELGFEELASRFLPSVEWFTSYPGESCEVIVVFLVVIARHVCV